MEGVTHYYCAKCQGVYSNVEPCPCAPRVIEMLPDGGAVVASGGTITLRVATPGPPSEPPCPCCESPTCPTGQRRLAEREALTSRKVRP